MAQRDPGAVARERAEIFGLDPPRPRPVARVYTALMAFILTVLALLLVPELAAAGTIYTVTNPGNGTGLTLADAIARANGSPGADTITFAPSAANDTFTLALPTIADTVTIDGGTGGVTLDFSGVSGDALTIGVGNVALNNLTLFGGLGGGINITSGGNDTFTHVLVHDFGGAGMLLGGAGNNTIGGTSAIFGNGADGIDLSSPGNFIGNISIGFRSSDGSVDPNGGFALAASGAGNDVFGNGIASNGTAIRLSNPLNDVESNAIEYLPPGFPLDVGAPGRNPFSPGTPTNPPTITGANVTPSGTTIDGTLKVEPNSGGFISVDEVSQAGTLTQLTPFAGTPYTVGGDGNFTWHITTNKVPKQGDRFVVFQANDGPNGTSSSEASDPPFDPFGQVGGGGGNAGGSTPRTCPFVPAVPAIQFQFARGEDANTRYVDALFQSALGHRAAPTQLVQFGSLLGSGSITRTQAAQLVFESADSRFRQADLAYLQLLGRHGSPAELQAAQNEATTLGELRMRAGLLASQELFTCSGATDASYVNQLFEDTLGRPADPAAVNLYGGQLGSGTPRSTLVSEIMGTTEARNFIVKNLYTELLNRQPDSQSLNFFTGLLAGSTEETVEERILSSSAFLTHIGTPPVFSAPTFLGNAILFNALQPVTVQVEIYRVFPSRAGDFAVEVAQRLRRVGVVRLGHHHKGRVRVRWNRTVNGHRLRPGRYVVVLQATGRGGRVVYQSDPIKLSIKH